ncbi:hypothetical protein BD779DRAFT_184591 [Infundibulicybe gibba]|nr:hypothetical protein BD779DRAFT_184591 [Infundibulicybe gibba]
MMHAPLRLPLLVCVFCLCISFATPRPHTRPYPSSSSSSSSSSLSSSFYPIHASNGFSTDLTTGMTTFTPPGNDTTHDLEARQVTPFTIVGIIVDVVGYVNQLIKILDGDKNARGEYTRSLVTGVRKRYPYFNVIVCHGPHDFKWNGAEGKDWLHQHKEFDIKAGGTVGYEMYIARSGVFRNQGDGDILIGRTAATSSPRTRAART